MTKLKHILLSCIGAFSLMGLPSCTSDLVEQGGSSQSGGLTLSLSVDGLNAETVTRVVVDATPDEQVVETLHLFFFESTSDQSGVLIDVIRLDAPELTGNTPIPTANSPVSASGAYRVIGVANAEDYAFNTTTWSESTEREFRNEAEALFPDVSIQSGKILMNGATTKPANEATISMKLTRNAARFDVVNSAGGYELVSASLRNIYNISSVTGDFTPDYSKDNTAAREGKSKTENATDNKITGKLYAFENLSTAPALGDAITTCYIVELKKEDASDGRFYRINVNPDESAQNIKRNKAYIATITGVTGEGYATAEEAYTSKDDQLNYTINNWDLGDNGLIVSDSYSILAVPVKTVQFGKAGGMNRYTITTFSTLTDPSPLTVKHRDIPLGIDCTLYSNILTVTASELTSTDEIRSGSITLTYAGLEATVNLLQSATVEAFLELSYEEGWSGLLSPEKGQETKKLFVNASGDWSAQIIGDPGFVFALNNSDVINSFNVPGNAFTIQTSSANPSNQKSRKAFVVVSLDKDPVNYVAVASVTQTASGNITISPLVNEVVFNGGGKIVSPAGVTSFVINTSGTIKSCQITGTNADKFKSILEGNILTISALGANSSPGDYTAMLTIQDDQNAELTIRLTQRPLSLKIVAALPTTVDATGGPTGLFYLDIDDDMAKCKVSVSANGVTRSIFNHQVTLEKEDGSAVNSNEYTLATQKYRVVFPRIYFPNRETDIRAVVTFTTESGATATYNFIQSKLASKGVHVWSSYRTAWGAISYNSSGNSNGSYFAAFNNYFRSHVLNGIASGNSSLTNTGSSSSGTAITGNHISYAHISNNGLSRGVSWKEVSDFMTKVDGITVFMADDYTAAQWDALNNSPLISLGYALTSRGSRAQSAGDNTLLNAEVSNTRVYDFIVRYGKQPVPANLNLYNDGTNTGVHLFPDGAVALLRYANGSYAMVIDPKNRVVYHGDCTNFHYTVNTSNGRQQFMSNYQDYLAYAAMYGSHFTDMLIDGSDIPEPWSVAWGNNAWPN